MIDLDGKLDAKFDQLKQHKEELGTKLFVLRLVQELASFATKAAWLAALIWAFKTMLEHH